MDNFQRQCKLCCSNISYENYKLIDDEIKCMLNVLLMKLNPNEGHCVLCTACSSNVVAAFNFKSTCLDTDNVIVPHVDLENSISVNLRNIYAKETGCNQGSSVLDDQEICRLCLKPTGTKSVLEVPFDSIQLYIPEINFAVTTNPTVCIECFDALQIHSAFIKKCSGKEEKINVFENKSYIKSEELEIKSEDVNDQKPVEIFYYNIKKEENEVGFTSSNSLIGIEDHKSEYSLHETCFMNHQSSRRDSSELQMYKWESEINHTDDFLSESNSVDKGNPKLQTKSPSRVQKYSCDECEYKTTKRAHLLTHNLRHKDPSEVKMYECEDCDYKTQLKHKDPVQLRIYKCESCSYTSIKKGNVKQHQSKHADLSQLEMYTCNECHYKCLYKSSLKRHQLTHKDLLQVQMYECADCDYRSNNKSNLSRHQLRHKDPDQLKVYACEVCGYRSVNKGNLKQHQLKHKDPSEVQMYECDECEYKSLKKDNLKQHQLKHADLSQGEMFSCNECHYKCLYKSTLNRHQLKHKDLLQVQMYECGDCDYRSNNKSNLSRHQLRHKDRDPQVKQYMCDDCDYKSISKGKLKQHQLKHKDPSEVNMYKCVECDYKSSRKDNLKQHRLRHKDPSQLEMFKCNACDYKSIEKGHLKRHQLRHKDGAEAQMSSFKRRANATTCI